MKMIRQEKHSDSGTENLIYNCKIYNISHIYILAEYIYVPQCILAGERKGVLLNYTFTIKGTLPGLNEYLKAERSFHNRHSSGNDMKQQYQMIISNAIRLNLKRTHINYPVRIKYTFYEPNRKRDLDNIAGVAHKFIQDALVKCKVLDNDGWNNIVGFEDYFYIDKHNPRIEVIITEVTE